MSLSKPPSPLETDPQEDSPQSVELAAGMKVRRKVSSQGPKDEPGHESRIPRQIMFSTSNMADKKPRQRHRSQEIKALDLNDAQAPLAAIRLTTSNKLRALSECLNEKSSTKAFSREKLNDILFAGMDVEVEQEEESHTLVLQRKALQSLLFGDPDEDIDGEGGSSTRVMQRNAVDQILRVHETDDEDETGDFRRSLVAKLFDAPFDADEDESASQATVLRHDVVDLILTDFFDDDDDDTLDRDTGSATRVMNRLRQAVASDPDAFSLPEPDPLVLDSSSPAQAKPSSKPPAQAKSSSKPPAQAQTHSPLRAIAIGGLLGLIALLALWMLT